MVVPDVQANPNYINVTNMHVEHNTTFNNIIIKAHTPTKHQRHDPALARRQ